MAIIGGIVVIIIATIIFGGVGFLVSAGIVAVFLILTYTDILESLYEWFATIWLWILGIVVVIVALILLFAFVPLPIVLGIFGVLATIGLAVGGICLNEDYPRLSALLIVGLLLVSLIGNLCGLTLWITIPASLIACYMIAFAGWEDAGYSVEQTDYGYYDDYNVWHKIGSRIKYIDLGIPGLIFNVVIYVGLPILGRVMLTPIFGIVALILAIFRAIFKFIALS